MEEKLLKLNQNVNDAIVTDDTATTKYINQATKNKIVNFLQSELPDVNLIIIFGSIISEHFDPKKSDIDIACLSFKPLSNTKRWNVQEKLASKLNINVDLVDLTQNNDVLKFEILQKGEIIFQKTSAQLENFLDHIFINYLQLNEDRAEIMEYYQ